MRRIFKGVSVLSAFFFLISLISVSVSWGQPLSMGRIELKGKGIVDAGKGLVFQAPKDKEAPLMPGSKVITEGKSSAVFDWSGKGSMMLYENGETGVGEDGFELFCSNEFIATLWEKLMNAGVTPCGLASRDVLRLEVCYPLYGHEIIHPEGVMGGTESRP